MTCRALQPNGPTSSTGARVSQLVLCKKPVFTKEIKIKKVNRMLLLRCCAAIGLLVFGLFLADKRWLLFDLNSLAFILIPTLAAFASVKFGKEGFAVTRGLILQVSIVGILIGFVGMLARGSDPSSIFGDAGGTALLVVLYACIVGGVCHLSSGNNETQINSAPLPNRILALVVWILLTGFAMHSVAGIGAFAVASALAIFGAFSIGICLPSENVENYQAALAKYLPVSGLIGSLVGVIAVLFNASDPKAIGPAMAIALLVSFYCNFASAGLRLLYPTIAEQDSSPPAPFYLGFMLLMFFGIYVALRGA